MWPPILYSQCVECHRQGEAAPMAFTSYAEVRPWAKAIKQAVLTRKMPPWLADPHYGAFRNDRRLPEDAIRTIVDLLRRLRFSAVFSLIGPAHARPGSCQAAPDQPSAHQAIPARNTRPASTTA